MGDSMKKKFNQLVNLGEEVWNEQSPRISKAYNEYQTAVAEFSTSTIGSAKESSQNIWGSCILLRRTNGEAPKVNSLPGRIL